MNNTISTLVLQSKGQRRVKGLHILDAMFLSGDDVSSLHYNERLYDMIMMRAFYYYYYAFIKYHISGLKTCSELLTKRNTITSKTTVSLGNA